MRARETLARVLQQVGRLEAAAEHYLEMLDLNPNDNQGIRSLIAPLLVELDRDEDALAVLKRYKDDAFATAVYVGVLLEYRKSGDSRDARKKLEKALKSNPHVPSFLTGKKRPPDTLPEYHRFGDESEAIVTHSEIFSAWNVTPGALEWLSEQTS